MLKAAGFDVTAAAFQRPYHSGRMPDCEIISLGQIDNGRYLRRGVTMLRALPQLRRAIARSQIVYAFGPDMALACRVAGAGTNTPIAVEVGDVRELQVARGISGRVVRKMEKRLINDCRLIIVTAPGFLDEYYREWLDVKTPALVMENKLEPTFVTDMKTTMLEKAPKPHDGKLRIGFFGVLRHEWAWQALEAVAKAEPDKVTVVIAGLLIDSLKHTTDRIRCLPNVEFLGEYQSPCDLPALYQSVDMVWACYPPISSDDWNLKWARTNRFYESCLFQTPILTRSGCQDAANVDRYDIGATIDDQHPAGVVDTIRGITTHDVCRWRRNMAELPRNVYSYTNEAQELKTALLNCTHHDEDLNP